MCTVRVPEVITCTNEATFESTIIPSYNNVLSYFRKYVYNQRLRRFGRRSAGGSAGRADRQSRSGPWFKTNTTSHERCLHVVARRAVEVRRTESSHATPRALPRAPARARAPCAQVARRPSVKSHDALSCEPTLETTTPVKHARSETARPIENRAPFGDRAETHVIGRNFTPGSRKRA